MNNSEPRSGGPMTATVDRVMNVCACSTCVENGKRGKINAATIQLWHRDVNLSQMDLQTLHAAIHRAAVSAAGYIFPEITMQAVDDRLRASEEIERHVRWELGL